MQQFDNDTALILTLNGLAFAHKIWMYHAPPLAFDHLFPPPQPDYYMEKSHHEYSASIVISFVYATGDYSLCTMKSIKKRELSIKSANNRIIIMHEAKEEEKLPQKNALKSLDVEDKLWLNMKHEPGTQWEAYKGEYWGSSRIFLKIEDTGSKILID